MNAPPSLRGTLVAVALCLGAGFAAASHLTLGFRAFTAEDARRIRVPASPVALAPLAVLDAAGQRRTLWSGDPAARAWLVSFIYTRCPSACVALGSEFQQLQRSMLAAGNDTGVRLASVSFDRAHDTSAELARYAARHRADPALWTVAVPASDAALAKLLGEAGVVVIGDGLGGYMHNAAIHVVTPRGKLVAIFDLERYPEAMAFAQALPKAGGT